MGEILKHPCLQPFEGKVTPYLLNSLSEDQLATALDLFRRGVISRLTTQGQLVSMMDNALF